MRGALEQDYPSIAKVLDLDANTCLTHVVRHWTPHPVIIRSSPTSGNFALAVVKSFECQIAISANLVQTVNNSNRRECLER